MMGGGGVRVRGRVFVWSRRERDDERSLEEGEGKKRRRGFQEGGVKRSND